MKNASSKDIKFDFKKLKAYTDNKEGLFYRYGVYIELIVGDNKESSEWFSSKWFKNGKEINN